MDTHTNSEELFITLIRYIRGALELRLDFLGKKLQSEEAEISGQLGGEYLGVSFALELIDTSSRVYDRLLNKE